jgi:electron transport complex protein RnfG
MSEAKAENIITRYALILALFTGLSGLILALVFNLTEPKKIANAKKIETLSRQEVIADVTRFEEVITGNYKYVKAYDDVDVLIGYVINAKESGYSSTIEMLVGLDLNFNIVGVKILSQSETPGLGTKITEEWFNKQFAGKSLNVLAVKKDGGEINAITGATISSRAVAKGIKDAVEKFKVIVSE